MIPKGWNKKEWEDFKENNPNNYMEKLHSPEKKPLDKMSDTELTNFWNKNAEKILLGQKIVRVEYMSKEDAEEMDWYSRPIQILLSNGVWLTPQQDEAMIKMHYENWEGAEVLSSEIEEVEEIK